MAEDELPEDTIHIGTLTLRWPGYGGDPTKMWIEQASGEGGEFSVEQVEAALQAFYAEHF